MADNPPIKPGDIVVLKSGSPRMVVEGIDDDGDAKCVWFSNGVVERLWFPLVVVEHADPPKEE